MDVTSREALARQLIAGCKEMGTRLRELAARLVELAPPDAHEVMAGVQLHVERVLAESDRVLGVIRAKR